MQVAQKVEQTTVAKQAVTTILNANNWLSIIGHLKLAAFARQLADNSAFIKVENNKVTLAIAPELAHLSSAKTQERLADALSKHLGQTIKLLVQQQTEQDAVATKPTLATERALKSQLNQKQAVDSIHNDPAVDELKQAFNGKIIESTIKPLD
jgi:DNA polymerase-3 subunit gamma/tau